jgi:hypothetical protein
MLRAISVKSEGRAERRKVDLERALNESLPGVAIGIRRPCGAATFVAVARCLPPIEGSGETPADALRALRARFSRLCDAQAAINIESLLRYESGHLHARGAPELLRERQSLHRGGETQHDEERATGKTVLLELQRERRPRMA